MKMAHVTIGGEVAVEAAMKIPEGLPLRHFTARHFITAYTTA